MKRTNFQLEKLNIKNFHGQDIQLSLSEHETAASWYFIGQNGSYKSTTLELIYTIFASISAPSIIKKNNFDYEIEYVIDSKHVIIKKTDEKYSLMVKEKLDIAVVEQTLQYKSATIDTVRRYLDKNHLLPSKILSFYSGENDRLKELEKQALRGYYRKFSNAIVNVQRNMESLLELPSRNYIHGTKNLIPLLLLISMTHKASRSFIKEYCQIDELEKITFSTNLEISSTAIDKRAKKDINNELLREKIPTIPFAEFIFDKIDCDIAAKLEGKWDIDAIENHTTYSRLIELNLKESSFKKKAIFRFFEAIATIFDGTLSISFKVGDKILTDTALSQGQRQWIEIIGLLILAESTSSIFLMDEPDAFMNPVWKYEFNKILASIEGTEPTGTNLIVTHDPLLINGIEKEQIRLFEKKDGRVYVTNPMQDTYGLGIDGLLRSQYYGLTTTYDQKTTEKFYRRMELYSKALNNELSNDSEKEELYKLTKELGSLPVFNSSIDYLYLDFLKEYRNSKYANEQYLSPDDLEKKNEEIKGIIESLYMRSRQ